MGSGAKVALLEGGAAGLKRNVDPLMYPAAYQQNYSYNSYVQFVLLKKTHCINSCIFLLNVFVEYCQLNIAIASSLHVVSLVCSVAELEQHFSFYKLISLLY